MIVYQQGRYFSVRDVDEQKKSLQKMLASLSPEEKKVFSALIAGAGLEGGKSDYNIKSLLEAIEYDQKPVSLDEFLFSDFFLGAVGRRLYSKLIDDLYELFEGNYYLAILGGAIGVGKSTFASVAMARLLYLFSCMRSPQQSLGLTDNCVISFVNMSVTLKLAQKVVFDSVANMLRESPYFRDVFKMEETKTELRFPKNIWFAPVVSSDAGALGLNIVAGCCDETNFFDSDKSLRAGVSSYTVSRAESVFNAIMRRMRSRYLQSGGGVAGILFVLSSERTPRDFTKKLINELRDDPGVFVRQYALWDVKPIFKESKRFQVLVDLEKANARILSDGEKVSPPGGNDSVFVLNVPEEFRRDFELDINGALRDIGGLAISVVHPFIPNKAMIEAMVDHGRVHPFSVEEWNPEKPADFLWSYLVKKVGERYRPIINPDAVRHIHIDLGLKKDACGICCAHIAGSKQVIRSDPSRTDKVVEVAPVFYVDFVLRIVPPPGGEILISDVRGLIYSLLEHGFNIRLVTFDSFESADSIQQLRRRGINADVLSVDATIVPYEILKGAIYDGRINVYRYDILLKELAELEKDELRKKIDHPIHGSKDVADALAGCVWSLSKKYEAQTQDVLPLVFGSSVRNFEQDYPSLSIMKELFSRDDEEESDNWVNVAKGYPFGV